LTKIFEKSKIRAEIPEALMGLKRNNTCHGIPHTQGKPTWLIKVQQIGFKAQCHCG
jgi:hypothetical protein